MKKRNHGKKEKRNYELERKQKTEVFLGHFGERKSRVDDGITVQSQK